jgi:cell division GTPase FtsZ
MACIYGGPKISFDDYGQAITVFDDYFPHDTTFVFGSVVDKRLGDAVRVAILAMK